VGGREGGKVRNLAGSSKTVKGYEEREEKRKPVFTGGKMKIKRDRENVTISQVGGLGGGEPEGKSALGRSQGDVRETSGKILETNKKGGEGQ
jgi:hypothetical protein